MLSAHIAETLSLDRRLRAAYSYFTPHVQEIHKVRTKEGRVLWVLGPWDAPKGSRRVSKTTPRRALEGSLRRLYKGRLKGKKLQEVTDFLLAKLDIVEILDFLNGWYVGHVHDLLEKYFQERHIEEGGSHVGKN